MTVASLSGGLFLGSSILGEDRGLTNVTHDPRNISRDQTHVARGCKEANSADEVSTSVDIKLTYTETA